MVATLVIILPSNHRGGELVIEHKGEKIKIGNQKISPEKLTCIAFYADCYHEVKKVTHGYRTVLTYNLIYEAPKKSKRFSGIDKSKLQAALKNYFYKNDFDKSSPLFGLLLDHEYTPSGIHWDLLKGQDKKRVQALIDASSELDLEISLCLADVRETWNCESDYDDYRDRRYGRYEEMDDEDDEEDDDSDYELIELIDSEVVFKNYLNLERKKQKPDNVQLAHDEIFLIKDNESFKPFDSEHEGWMGNYGNTMDKWYHRGAVVLWKKKDAFKISLSYDLISSIRETIEQLKKKSSPNAIEQASEIIRFVQTKSERSDSYDNETYIALFDLLACTASAELAKTGIKFLLPRGLNCVTASSFLDLTSSVEKLGFDEQWMPTPEVERYFHEAQFENFFDLSSTIFKGHLAETTKNVILSWLFNCQISSIKKIDQRHNKNFRPKWPRNIKSKTKNGKNKKDYPPIFEIIETIFHLELESFLGPCLSHIETVRLLYSDFDLLSFILELKEKYLKSTLLKNSLLQELIIKCIDGLKKELEKGARKENDWSIKIVDNCRCEDCEQLHLFLQNSENQKTIMPLRKDRRQHLHSMIDAMEIPVDHETMRVGSPQKLVLTKVKRLFTDSQHRLNLVGELLGQCEKIN